MQVSSTDSSTYALLALESSALIWFRTYLHFISCLHANARTGEIVKTLERLIRYMRADATANASAASVPRRIRYEW